VTVYWWFGRFPTTSCFLITVESRDENESGLMPILAGSGLDRTEKIFVVLMWLFWKPQKF